MILFENGMLPRLGWQLISKVHKASLSNDCCADVLSWATLLEYYQVPP